VPYLVVAHLVYPPVVVFLNALAVLSGHHEHLKLSAHRFRVSSESFPGVCDELLALDHQLIPVGLRVLCIVREISLEVINGDGRILDPAGVGQLDDGV
jgi:hypothetical protein